MSEEIKKLIEEQGRAFEEFKAENDKRLKELKDGRSDPVLAEKVDRINTEITNLSKLKREEEQEKAQLKSQLDAIETILARGQFPGGGNHSDLDNIKAEHSAAFEKWFRHGGDSNMEAVKELAIKAGLSTLDDPNGGYLRAPAEFDTAIERVAGTISVMRRLATVRLIGTDEYKKLVNKGGASSGWVAEKESRTETDTPTLAQITLNTKEMYAEPGTTQKSLDDSIIDIAAWLADEVSTEFNEEEGTAFITGDGVAKPHGIAGYTFVANASYEWGKVGYIAGGHATLLNNADKLVSLVHALKPAYRNGASFLMNDSTCEIVRTLKNGNGDYIWRAGLEQGRPDSLLGKPVEYDDNVADIGANAYPIFFGNFKRAYLIIDRMGIRILRDPYTNKGNVLFYSTKRVGGGIVLYEAIKALRIATS